MGPLHEGSIRRPIASWANALPTELHLAPGVTDDEKSGSEVFARSKNDIFRLCESSNIHLRDEAVIRLVLWFSSYSKGTERWSFRIHPSTGAGRSSEVERSLVVRRVVGSILLGVDPLSYFSFQPVLHDWCNKGRGMCYPVCGMVHIKEPLLLIDKSSLCGGSGFPFSLSEWSLTICLTPYNRR